MSYIVASFINSKSRLTSSSQAYLSSVGYTDVTGATATSLANTLKSVYTSIHTRTEYLSAWSVIQTAIPTDVYKSLEDKGYDYIETTAPPSWYTGLPDSVKDELMEEQDALQSAADEVLEITRTSTGGATQQTAPIVAGGMAAAGFLGAIAML